MHSKLALQSRRRALSSTCGLVAMTSASHAEGRQLDPGQVYVFRQSTHLRWQGVSKWLIHLAIPDSLRGQLFVVIVLTAAFRRPHFPFYLLKQAPCLDRRRPRSTIVLQPTATGKFLTCHPEGHRTSDAAMRMTKQMALQSCLAKARGGQVTLFRITGGQY